MRCAYIRGQLSPYALRDSALTPAREAITLAGLRIERHAELAQLLDGLPDGGARHGQISRQRLAGEELPVVERWNTRCGSGALRESLTRAATEQPERGARGSVPAAHARGRCHDA
jgi:hypothetical protein